MTEIFIKNIHPLVSNDFERKIPRQPKDQQEDYLEKYDLHSIFYDVMITDDNYLAFVSPPLYGEYNIWNLAKIEINGQLINGSPEFVEHSRVTNVYYKLSDEYGNALRAQNKAVVDFELGNARGKFEVDTKDFELLRGHNVFGSMTKDTELTWLHDWVEYHVRVDKFDALILFDNNSSKYMITEMSTCLADIPKLKKLIIVPYTVKFGPVAKPGVPIYDSDYGQYTALEMAHQRFLPQAKTFTHVDTDEYIFPLEKGNGIIDSVLSSESAELTLLGYNVLPIFDEKNIKKPLNELRVYDFKYNNINNTPYKYPINDVNVNLKNFGARKYIVDLTRTPRDVQLGVHAPYKWITTSRKILNNVGSAFILDRYTNVKIATNFSINHYRVLSASSWKSSPKRYLYKIDSPIDIPMDYINELINPNNN
ncbi:hypothetical protein [Weissella soli]|uniref:Uncharacterized protein n=1 Tax=Weissella soli TaxID=155866 RepID=A0A288QY68_9LACO|nr:hypothetical protein [Weissella soli]AOT57103.1 hypothetical protein WSWS_01520 [Weissella soli]MCT8395758.1 hypothetical protein [Weissella soli]NKY83925.1 hypothetical protein [Weissella soli]RDL01113.1 hypothetical protein DFP99_1584 [Weissella soli]GEN93840.1 hypothetical protein WSO01_14520 [Weissella soli]